MIAKAKTEELRAEVAIDRGKVSAVKSGRRERLRRVAAQCKAVRERHMVSAKRRRDALRESIQAARTVIREKCKAKRGDAMEVDAERLIAAIGELADVRDRLALHLAGIQIPPKDPGRVRGGQRAAELLAETIDQVANDLEEVAPELVPVWRNMARRMPARYRPSGRRSALEGFTEWAEDHAGEVADIQDRLLDRSINQLEDIEMEARSDEREEYEAREAKRFRANRKLARVTKASARKLDADALLGRFEAVMGALAIERDDAQSAILRSAYDELQGELQRRGLFQPFDDHAAADVPF